MGGVAGELVFQLDADDRAAVGVEEPLKLLPDRAEPAAHLGEIPLVVRAEPERLFHKPVGETAVAALAVRPRAGTHDNLEALFLRLKHEIADGEIAGETEFALDFFVMDPEEIGGNDVDAARFQFRELGGPLVAGDARKMQFAHDRDPRLAVAHEVQAVDADLAAGRILSAEIQVVREDFRFGVGLERAADRRGGVQGGGGLGGESGIGGGEDCGGHKKRSCQMGFHWLAPEFVRERMCRFRII